MNVFSIINQFKSKSDVVIFCSAEDLASVNEQADKINNHPQQLFRQFENSEDSVSSKIGATSIMSNGTNVVFIDIEKMKLFAELYSKK